MDKSLHYELILMVLRAFLDKFRCYKIATLKLCQLTY